MVSLNSPRGVALQSKTAHVHVQRNRNGTRLSSRIQRITEDLTEIKSIYPITISKKRTAKLHRYLDDELTSLHDEGRRVFDDDDDDDDDDDLFDQQDKIDYLLLRSYLERQVRELERGARRDSKTVEFLPFLAVLVGLCEDRAEVVRVDPEVVAQRLWEVKNAIAIVIGCVEGGGNLMSSIDKSDAFHAARTVDSLRDHLREWFGFYNGYDPLFNWWVSNPYGEVDRSLQKLASTIREKLVGIRPGDETDAIVGEPVGRDGILEELQAEFIAYSPEEIIAIGEREFAWCVDEMKNASRQMDYDGDDYGDNWHLALEEVKNDYVDPGQQTQLVKDLAWEAIEFVEKHNLITVPTVAKETWQMFMMTPERQKVNPFFLGGDSIIVSYPTDSMDHEAKLMSMRGNNIHFARATVFHELIPGHRLQAYMNSRSRPYRRLFETPFWIEGWSLYWEMILWDDQRFVKTARNRMGMLFWRLHRCARIIFSIKFHLGQMTAQECVDLLVEQVGHERATAEGEVRRSLAGEYSALYQAGYMLGALQIHALRREMVEMGGMMTEKEFHDAFLRENFMSIELLRALMQRRKLSREYRPEWRFY